MKRFIISLVFTVSFLFNTLYAQLVYQKKPRHFKPQIEVATCFIKVDDKILVLKRLPFKPQGNTWGTPGGKFDQGENAQTAVIRETREETGIELPPESMTYFGKVYVRYPQMDYTLHLFEYHADDCPKVTITPDEHADYRWVTLEEALAMPLIPGEEECIDLIYGVQRVTAVG